ncbi:MAG: hypothetical protein HGA19_06990 [Oscillochloris sp.]|nr:hypothetical protein [Oscillochloris sp.]
MFDVNSDLISSARKMLIERRNIYWIIGSSASGKSTICRSIADHSGIATYDMDAHIYGSYFPRYTTQRHPAVSAWLRAENPLAWMLKLAPDDFDAFNRATTAEYLDLLAEDLDVWPADQPILVDGGITHPSIIIQAVTAQQLICLSVSEEERVRVWETAESRAVMRNWISELPEPEEMWRRFLAHDTAIAVTLERESRTHRIPILFRHSLDTVDGLMQRVLDQFMGYEVSHE